MDIESIVKKQKLSHKLLRQRRMQFLDKCFSNYLYRNYIRNRYLNEEYRNEFEIVRMWDKITLELVDKMTEESRGTILQMLTERCEEVSCVLNSCGMEYEQHLLKESSDNLKIRYKERMTFQDRLMNGFVEGKKEREFIFMELMIEMMDTAERLNKKRGE